MVAAVVPPWEDSKHVTGGCGVGVVLLITQSIVGLLIDVVVFGLVYAKITKPARRIIMLRVRSGNVPFPPIPPFLHMTIRDRPSLLTRINTLASMHLVGGHPSAGVLQAPRCSPSRIDFAFPLFIPPPPAPLPPPMR